MPCQASWAPAGDVVQQAGGGFPHPGAHRISRVAGEQVPDRLAEFAVLPAVHAQHVPRRVTAGDFGAGQRGLAPVGHAPRRGAFHAQQVAVPVNHPHGLATGRGRDPGMALGQHRGEPAAGRGSEGERDRGGPLTQGAGGGHGGHSFGAPHSLRCRELRHQSAAPAPPAHPRGWDSARFSIPGDGHCSYLDACLAPQVTRHLTRWTGQGAGRPAPGRAAVSRPGRGAAPARRAKCAPRWPPWPRPAPRSRVPRQPSRR